MKKEIISKIIIGNDRRLMIFPKKENFQYIYRTASGVNWNNDKKYLFSEIPREWNYIKWFNHMLSNVLSEYGIILKITRETLFENIDISLKKQLKTPKNIIWQIESPNFVFKQKHKCPNCDKKISTEKIYEIINQKSPEAKKYDFSTGDGFPLGDVIFIYYIFYCEYCNRRYKIKEIRNHEKNMNEIKIIKMNRNKLIKFIKIIINKLFYGII
jgi:hypothetical protein